MQETKQIFITQEGLKKLEDELEFLRTVKRKEVVETIKTALSFGDLSENSEYDEAKNEQAKVEVRIMEIERTLENIKVVGKSMIKMQNLDTKAVVEYCLVGPTEANPFEKKISTESPIGKAVADAKVGDEVEYEAQGRTFRFKILEISHSM